MSTSYRGFLVEATLDEFRAAIDGLKLRDAKVERTLGEISEPLTPEQTIFLEAKAKLRAAGFAFPEGQWSPLVVSNNSGSYAQIIGLASELIGNSGVFRLRFPRNKQTLDFDFIEVDVGKGVAVASAVRAFELKLAAFGEAKRQGQLEPGIFSVPPGASVQELSNEDGSSVAFARLPGGRPSEIILRLITPHRQRVCLRYDADGALVRVEIAELAVEYSFTKQVDGSAVVWLDSRSGLARHLEIEQALGSRANGQAEIAFIDFDEPKLSRFFAIADRSEPQMVAEAYAGLFADIERLSCHANRES